jgi:hypothetical protein
MAAVERKDNKSDFIFIGNDLLIVSQSSSLFVGVAISFPLFTCDFDL